MPPSAYHPFPVLLTPRLLLRQLEPDDAPDLQLCRTDEQVMRFLCRKDTNVLDDSIRLIRDMNELIKKKEAITWAIILKESGKLIGSIGFVKIDKETAEGEIGYILASSFQRLGIMHEAISMVIDFGFNQLKLNSIKAIVDPLNEASISLLKKNQFEADHFKSDANYFEREYLGSLVYRLPAEPSDSLILSYTASVEAETIG